MSFFVADLHVNYACIHHAQLPGGFFCEVDDPAGNEGAAIVNAHFDGAAVGKIGDFYLGAEGQGFMRGGHAALPEDLATGGFATLEFVGVIRRLPAFGDLARAGRQ